MYYLLLTPVSPFSDKEQATMYTQN